jgi:hypothetical protein
MDEEAGELGPPQRRPRSNARRARDRPNRRDRCAAAGAPTGPPTNAYRQTLDVLDRHGFAVLRRADEPERDWWEPDLGPPRPALVRTRAEGSLVSRILRDLRAA